MTQMEMVTFESRELGDGGMPKDYNKYVLIAFDADGAALCEVLRFAGGLDESIPDPFMAQSQCDAIDKARGWLANRHSGLPCRSYPVTVSDLGQDELQKWIDLSKKLLGRS